MYDRQAPSKGSPQGSLAEYTSDMQLGSRQPPPPCACANCLALRVLVWFTFLPLPLVSVTHECTHIPPRAARPHSLHGHISIPRFSPSGSRDSADLQT